jgi:hypothetical protein
MKKEAKEKTEAAELLKKHRELIDSTLPGLDKVYLLGTILSLSERPDVAYAGKVIEEIIGAIGRDLCVAVPEHNYHQFNEEIPF